MQSYIAGLVFLFLGCFLVGCGGTKSNPSKPEEKQESKTDDANKPAGQNATGLDGMWTMVSQTSDGIGVHDEGVKISFAGDKVTFHGRTSKTMSIKVDTTKTPHEINLMRDDPDAPDGIPGIYEVKGDTLKIAMGQFAWRTSPPNRRDEEPKKELVRTPRPKNFDDAQGADIMILKRGGVLLSHGELKKLIVGKWHIGSASISWPIFGDIEFTADGKFHHKNVDGVGQIASYSIEDQTLMCTAPYLEKGKQVDRKFSTEIFDVTDAELKTSLFKAKRIQ